MFRLGQVVKTMNQSALALDKIADDFATTDADAVHWLDRHQAWLARHGYGGDPPAANLPAYPGS